MAPTKPRKEIASLLDEPLPFEPQPMESILREVKNNIFANSTLNLSPRFFSYINSGGNQASIFADLLASAVNAILSLWHFSLQRQRWNGEWSSGLPTSLVIHRTQEAVS